MLKADRFLSPLLCAVATAAIISALTGSALAQSTRGVGFSPGAQASSGETSASGPRLGPTAFTLDAAPSRDRSNPGRIPTLIMPPAAAPVMGLGAKTFGSERSSGAEEASPSPMTLGLPRAQPTQTSEAGEEDERATSSDRRPSRQSGLVRLPAAKPEKSQAESVAGQRIEGRVIVVDGDTMLVGSRLVRLHGIDAPHRRQNCVSGVAAWACGERAARRLAELADGRDVSCVATVPAGEGVAAVCRTPEGDLAKTMVRDGMAAVARWIPGIYGPVEDQARAARRGMWAGSFTLPWLWTPRG